MIIPEPIKTDTISGVESIGVISIASDKDGNAADIRILDVKEVYATKRSAAGEIHISCEEPVFHGHSKVIDT